MIEDSILKRLSTKETISSIQLEKQFNLSSQILYGILVSLQSHYYIEIQIKKSFTSLLTNEGQSYAQKGTPQHRIYLLASIEGTPKEQIQEKLKDVFKIGFGHAMKKKYVEFKTDIIYRSKQEFKDKDQENLNLIKNGKIEDIKPEDLKVLKQRKLVQDKQTNEYIIKKGKNYKIEREDVQTQITSQMLADNSWKKYNFKQYNAQSKGAQTQNGNLHPLMKTKEQFTSILLEMGFQQMNTNRYVESSFWNFDSLFQPQAHPARDAHDTFFLTYPHNSKIQDPKFFQATRDIHEKGGFGSLGYDYKWDPNEAYKNILRTHTTAISSRYLKMIADQLAQGKQFKPRKFFSIDRVFRNQTLDNTHLAQFHQVEGFIIDYNLGLPDLIGVLSSFYQKIGIQDILLKPTYNPYTQPSMEVFGYHPILKKKVQIGNSGIFRPEMLRPMGFPENVSVIAWGLSLQRPTMIQFNLSNIKQLFGPGVSIRKVKDSAIYCI